MYIRMYTHMYIRMYVGTYIFNQNSAILSTGNAPQHPPTHPHPHTYTTPYPHIQLTKRQHDLIAGPPDHEVQGEVALVKPLLHVTGGEGTWREGRVHTDTHTDLRIHMEHTTTAHACSTHINIRTYL